MKIGIIGVGKIGTMHAACFERAGLSTLLVDPRSARPGAVADLDEVDDVTHRGVAAWVVAAPTSLHLGLVERLLARDPASRIIVEKPVAAPGELDRFADLVARHPAARVRVNDLYGHSVAVRKLAGAVRGLTADGRRITRVTVELSKNRNQDLARGRFVDFQYGDLGYEWFHVLSILRTVLGPERYASFLERDPASGRVSPEIREEHRASDLPAIELYASVRGRLGHPRRGAFAFLSPQARREIESGEIPTGSSLCYRFAEVEVEGGARATLVLEHGAGVSRDAKNRHALVVRDGALARMETIATHQLEHGMMRQLGLLMDPDAPAVCLELGAHHRMARLRALIGTRPALALAIPQERTHA